MPLHARLSCFRSSFQFKLFCVFTLLTAFTTTFLCALYITSEIKEKSTYTREKVRLQARQLADSVRLPLYAENHAVLQQLAEESATEPEIRAVEITASDGRKLVAIHAPTPSDSNEVISLTVDVQNHKLLDSIESSLSGGQNVSVSRLGTVRIERGTADLSRAVREFITLSAGSAFVFWLLVSTLCYLALRKVTHSFNALMSGIEAMQCGDFTSRIEVVSDDEPGRAAGAINDLASALLQRGEENIRLQEERLNLERQMFQNQKLESLGIMAGGIAHDYNNLLQSILGNIELASMKLDPDSSPHKYIANAISSGKHAAHLTNLMLTYVGKGYVTKKELNLNALVRENADMLKTAASSAVSTELHLSAEIPVILADEAHIQQIVMNLIINATESILEQPGFIRITTGSQNCDQSSLSRSLLNEKPEPGRFVFLEISDNGCGMSEETLERLFDPFFTTKFTGRGLGMSAVMGITPAHCLWRASRAGGQPSECCSRFRKRHCRQRPGNRIPSHRNCALFR